jgi:plasmid stability protein
MMAEVLIRNLDEETVARLKQRAARSERSLQAELQRIIERAASADVIESAALAARIRKKLSNRKHSDSTMLIAEDRKR